jgi:hypothetical protein
MVSAILLLYVWCQASHSDIHLVQMFPITLLSKYILNTDFSYILVSRHTTRASWSRILQMNDF